MRVFLQKRQISPTENLRLYVDMFVVMLSQGKTPIQQSRPLHRKSEDRKRIIGQLNNRGGARGHTTGGYAYTRRTVNYYFFELDL